MANKSDIYKYFLSLAGAWLLCLFATSIGFSAQPGFDVNWNAYTWKTNADHPRAGLGHWVEIIDHDGISQNGDSHTVTVTYPDSSVKTLYFLYRQNDTSAIYEYWDENDPTGASGNYTYRVTDNGTGEWSEMTDHVEVKDIAPLDETSFSPGYGSPVSLEAGFDNVHINGSLYDDFNSGFDGTKWEALPHEATISSGEACFNYTWDTAQGRSIFLNLKNPETINELKATVRIDKSSGDEPYARIGGTFCHDGTADVYARIGIKGDEAVYYVARDVMDGTHLIYNKLTPPTNLGPLTQGHRYELTLGWDGTRFLFNVQGLDDAVYYTEEYSPSGTITATNSPRRFIGMASWPILNTTNPTFDWDEVSGATYYRVRLYTWHNQTIHTGYAKTPPYTLPPGILKPNGMYKYRIRAIAEPQWFEADNTATSDRELARFIAGPVEPQQPYINFDSHGVYTWNQELGTNTHFYLKIHDAQGVPGNIKRVKVLFPDGSTELDLYHDYNETETCAIYRNSFFGPIQTGTYTYTLIDKDFNADIKTENLTVDPVIGPIGYPAESSLIPANSTLLGDTAVHLDWDDVPGAAFYQVDFYDKDLNFLFRTRNTESEFSLWPGLLKEKSLYRYRVLTWDSFWEENQNGGSSSPFSSLWNTTTFLTTVVYGSHTPAVRTGLYGAACYQGIHSITGSPVYTLIFDLMVEDSDGVPENIQKVEVTYPDGITKKELKYLNEPLHGRNYYTEVFFNDLSLIQDASNSSGVYQFEVTDFDGNRVFFHDTLPKAGGPDGHILPVPMNLSPAQGAVMDTTTPVISWDPVPGAAAYRVRIMNAAAGSTRHWSSGLDETEYTIPCGLLDPETTYAYKVYAFDAPLGEDIDFMSGYPFWHRASNRFTTGVGCTGDFDIDDDVDGKNLATFIERFSAGTAGIPFGAFCTAFGH